MDHEEDLDVDASVAAGANDVAVYHEDLDGARDTAKTTGQEGIDGARETAFQMVDAAPRQIQHRRPARVARGVG